MINKIYFSQESIQNMRDHFRKTEPKFLLLNDFLISEEFNNLKKKLKKSNWKNLEEPDRFSYHESLPKFVQELFLSPEFLLFVESFFGKKVKSVSLKTKKFGCKNYTLVHDSYSDGSKKGFIFFVAENWKEDFGGQIVFVDKNSENYIFVPKGNSILFFDKPKGMNDFVKYVNNRAKKESFVLVEFLLG